MSYSLTTKSSWAHTQQDLQCTFDKWNVKEWTTNYPRGARLHGYNQSEVDRTVTLSYTKGGRQVNLEMGKQPRAVDNLRVLYLAIEDMRMIEKRGLSETIQSAYMQIAGPKPKLNPYDVLGIMPGESLELAETAFKIKAMKAHPDKGGSVEAFQELTDAIKMIREEKKS